MSPESWLTSSLANHPIFTLPEPSSDDDKHGRRRELKETTMVVRGGDLLVAVGSRIRMCSLSEAKSGAGKGGTSGHYKTLISPTLDFPILQLVPNPTGKLLAVVGAHQLVVVVLPRPGYIKLITPTIECRSIPIGLYYHSPASPSISKVLWHPYGSLSSSLLVLSLDGLLREYDPLQDSEEPQQTISLLPPRAQKASGGGGRFEAEERGAREAVSFCLGKGEGDWGMLSVYGLMGNGDVYGVCPFLPANATIPQSYIRALSTFTSSKLDYLSELPTPAPPLPLTSTSTSPSRLSSTSPSFLTRYNAQTTYIDALLSQIDEHTSSHPAEMDVDDSSEPVLVHPPKLMGGGRKREPLVQGPFLFQPAPRELEEEEVEGGEDVEEIGIRATDIFLVDGKSSSTGEEMEGEEKKAKGEVGVVGIVFADGRVDLCLEVEKLEALWVGRQETTQSNPILAVYETIDLGLLSQATSSSPSPSSSDSRSRSPSPPSLKTVLARSSPSFFLDPLYDDTVYISHAFGVHCLSMRNWIDGLRTALGGGNKGDEDGSLALGEFFERAVGTEVVRVVDTVSETDRTSAPISSIAIISDVYLSYSFLALTSSLQLVALPLSLRIASPPSSSLSASSNTPPPPSSSVKSTSSTGSKPAYTSLLSTQPFTLPQILSQPSTSLPVKPLFAAPSSSTTTGPLSTITPSTLRTLGKSIQSLRSTLHDILSASSTVQARLDLQLLELSRQLQKTTKIETLLSPSPVNSSSSTEPSPSTTTKSPAALKNRVDSVVRSQEVLIARVDKVLQKLMDQHQPVLSDYEKEWFAELGRMKGEVGVSTLDGQETERSSGSTTDGLGLKSRTAMLESHLALLRPKLLVMSQKLADAQALKNSQQQKKTAALGRLQLRQLEKQLADESKMIASVTSKLDSLSVKAESLDH